MILFSTISTHIIAQDNAENIIVAQNLTDESMAEIEPLINRYFEDIQYARKKITQVKNRVEYNFKNKLFGEKKYLKQVNSLNNMLINLEIIEDRRLHIINKRRNK